MIVNTGKDVIKQYFGGQVAQIGDTLAFGTGTTAEALTDTALVAEVFRVAVDSINADLDNSRIVFKATIPAGSPVVTIDEIGLYNAGSAGDGGTLVARVVLADAQTVDSALPCEVEYSMAVSV